MLPYAGQQGECYSSPPGDWMQPQRNPYESCCHHPIVSGDRGRTGETELKEKQVSWILGTEVYSPQLPAQTTKDNWAMWQACNPHKSLGWLSPSSYAVEGPHHSTFSKLMGYILNPGRLSGLGSMALSSCRRLSSAETEVIIHVSP